VAVQLERQPELGADAIGAGNQHRLPEFLRNLDQRTEATDARQHFGAHGASGQRLDTLDQRIAGVDIDAGIFIGNG